MKKLGKKDLSVLLSERTGTPVYKVDKMLTDLIWVMNREFRRGNEVSLRGLGTFYLTAPIKRKSPLINEGDGIASIRPTIRFRYADKERNYLPSK